MESGPTLANQQNVSLWNNNSSNKKTTTATIKQVQVDGCAGQNRWVAIDFWVMIVLSLWLCYPFLVIQVSNQEAWEYIEMNQPRVLVLWKKLKTKLDLRYDKNRSMSDCFWYFWSYFGIGGLWNKQDFTLLTVAFIKVSVQYCLFVMPEKFREWRDKEGKFWSLLTDVSKAFDCISNILLITK